MQILDKGDVSLVNSMASDLSVVAAARVSNGVTLADASKGSDADQKLINYLMKHRHGTPFEHTAFTFHVKCPLFVAREWQRHRIGSFNEVSGRYTEFEPEFYLPKNFRIPGKTNKQGSEFPPPTDIIEAWDELNSLDVQFITNKSYEVYKLLLVAGVAKEMARIVLPLNLYTQFYWTINARSLMNFLSLRTAEDAQWEIRQYANAIEDMFKQLMPMTHIAWINNERIAP